MHHCGALFLFLLAFNTFAGSSSLIQRGDRDLGYRYYMSKEKCILRDSATRNPVFRNGRFVEGLNRGFYRDEQGSVSAVCSDLRGRNLRGKDLSDIHLIGANFNSAQLQFASFIGTVLTKATFRNARLAGANFINAISYLTDFSGADLSSTNFSTAVLRASQFDQSQLRGAHFFLTYFDRSDLSEAKNFSLAFFKNAMRNSASQFPTQTTDQVSSMYQAEVETEFRSYEAQVLAHLKAFRN